jgi:putative endonuclease
MTASVYILYSPSLDSYYIGFTTTSVKERLNKHNEKYYDNSFTSKANDWEICLSIECLSEKHAKSIESHIKKMKSRTYILNLKRYPDIIQKLLKRYEIN